MELLPISEIKINQSKIDKIDHLVKSIYRLIIYSRHHLDDDLLDIYLASVQELQELLSIKNAQMEAQNQEEEEEYLKNLKISLVLKPVLLFLQLHQEKKFRYCLLKNYPFA
jgi:deoxyadenosine/deoxycytidine kinase